MVFQNSHNILGIILHICYPISQKLYVLHWPVKILQSNPIGVPLIYFWENLLGNTLNSSYMMLDTRCIEQFTYFQVSSYYNYQL